MDGYEADDVIGTLSIQAAKEGYEVFMVTPDKDYGQLVDGNIKIYKPGYQGGDAEILGAKEVCEKMEYQGSAPGDRYSRSHGRCMLTIFQVSPALVKRPPPNYWQNTAHLKMFWRMQTR